MDHLNDMMRLVGEELSEFANSNVVVGNPIEFSTATVVPISRLSVALGGGGAGGEGGGHLSSKKKSQGKGQGAGGASSGAARVRPIAVVVFTEKRVDVLAIPEKPKKRDKLLDMIPDVVKKFTKNISVDDDDEDDE